MEWHRPSKFVLISLFISMLAFAGRATGQEEDIAAPIGLFGLFCALYGAVIIVIIAIAVWVYRDAEKRGMNGALWLIVVLVGSIIGLIIYLIIRRDHPIGGRPYWAPPTPPAYPAPPICPYCRGVIAYEPNLQRWYCGTCRRYM